MTKRLLLGLLFSLAACHSEPAQRTPVATGNAGAEADPFADGVETTGTATHGHGSAIATLGITPPDSPWQSMSMDDREMYMIGKVLPIMKELFATHDDARYADVGCETCHGTDMHSASFRMPPRAAMPVPPRGTPAYARLERQFPDSVRFMEQTVSPTMGTLLGVASYGCEHCHPTSATP